MLPGPACTSLSFTKLGKVSVIIFSIMFLISFPLFSFWHLHDENVGTPEVVSETPYTILIFLDSFFFFSEWVFLMFQIAYLILGFIHSTADTL